METEAPDGRVGVVMITRNRRDEALSNVARLRALPERPRVIVVDNASSDGTVEALSAQGEATVLPLPRNLGAAGRTLGMLLLATPYVAFADDDSWWDPGAIRLAADVLDTHPRVAVVCGSILTGTPEGLDPICEEMRDSPVGNGEAPGPDLVSFLAGASVIRRCPYMRAGGFEARLLIGGEEELLATDLLTAGWRLVYVPEVVAHHHASTVRDAHGRRRIGIRNTLWTTWLRRPLRSVVRRTSHLVVRLPRDRVSLLGVADAVRGVGWVLTERRTVPREVESKLQLVEQAQLQSKARRYVS